MATDRNSRYANAGELYQDLKSALEKPGEESEASIPEHHESVPEPEPDPLPSPSGKTIFLATVSQDLELQRERIRQELVSRGHRVVPATSEFPLAAPQAEGMIRSALMAADLAVHAIGGHYGWIPDGADRSIVEIQHRLSEDHGRRSALPRLIWLPRGLHLTDDRQRRFRISAAREADRSPNIQVIESPLEPFLEELFNHLQPPKAEAVNVNQPLHIHLIHEPIDDDLADRVEDYLFDLGFEVTSARRQQRREY